MPVLSNLTGASQGTGADKRLFLSQPYVNGADAGDGVEALVTSGTNLRQLTGDPPAAPFQVLGPRADLPVYVHQGDVAADHPAARARPARPPGASSWAPTRPPTVARRHPARPAARGRHGFSFANANGTPRTPTRVFEVHLRNRWTTWRYRDKGDGSITSTEAEPAARSPTSATPARSRSRRPPRSASSATTATHRRSPVSSRTSTSSRPQEGSAMATTYKTPGVYIEEIPKFPPSVAPVDTAIPAFIGYTEKAIDEVADDLHLKPKRIESLVEYEQYFGGPQPETEIVVTIDETTGGARQAGRRHGDGRARRGDRSKHILYYALQLFYANGGGACYIVSVGQYKAHRRRPRSQTSCRPGSTPLSKVDEPTLIVFPEAQALAHRRLQDAARRRARAVRGAEGPLRDHGRARRRRVRCRTPTANLIDAVDELPQRRHRHQQPELRRRLRAEPRDRPRLRVRRDADRRDARRSTAPPPRTRRSTTSRPPTTSSTSGPRRRSRTCPLIAAAERRRSPASTPQVDNEPRRLEGAGQRVASTPSSSRRSSSPTSSRTT